MQVMYSLLQDLKPIALMPLNGDIVWTFTSSTGSQGSVNGGPTIADGKSLLMIGTEGTITVLTKILDRKYGIFQLTEMLREHRLMMMEKFSSQATAMVPDTPDMFIV